MARSRSIGIRDLAGELGMSISTVSRAMNSRGEVSAQTRARVVEAAERLGYSPNQSGRSLRHGATETVALVMPTGTARTESGETFFLNVSDGLQQTLSPAGLTLVILAYGSSQNPDEYLARAVDRHLADAFVLADTQRVDPRIKYLLTHGVPFVSLGRTRAGGHSYMDLDVEDAATQAVDRLVRFGHTRIALARSERDVNTTTLFADAYRRALAAHGLPYDPAIVLSASDHRGAGGELAEQLLAVPEPPTALVLEVETLAISLFGRLRKLGLEPGRDLAVIGFRANPVLELLHPTLTAFEVDLPAYGRRLGELVLQELAAGPSAEPIGELWPMTLVPGASDSPD
jgi:DNA-binding LacI/PurR family transcriptional regulator